MNFGELLIILALAENIFLYESGESLENGLKIPKYICNQSKKLLNAYKKKYKWLIRAEDDWEYYYLNMIYNLIESGEAKTVNEAVEMYDKDLNDCMNAYDNE